MLRGNLRRGLALVRRRTLRGSPLPVRLYERAGCHLCDESHRALRRIGLDLPLEIQRIDVDADDALVRRYTLRVPVIAVGPDELDAAGLDDAALGHWLRARPRAGERP
ncbi:MAG TPA: glutaredoxin family protein [Candidatus Saccharimonadales bacterium]|nr:glutaredoxin family protein [Candidatus Saccharimonadales bacterium]